MCVREKRNHQASGMLQKGVDWGGGREVGGDGIVLERSRAQG